MLDLKGGEAVLDVGSGPGLLAAEMAEAVGPEGTVRGVDPSESMLALARRRQDRAGKRRGAAAVDSGRKNPHARGAASGMVGGGGHDGL